LTPFVTRKITETKGSFPGSSPLSGQRYLDLWKESQARGRID